MKPRINAYKAEPDAVKALMELENELQRGGLEPSLIDRVKTRASDGLFVHIGEECNTQHGRKARHSFRPLSQKRRIFSPL